MNQNDPGIMERLQSRFPDVVTPVGAIDQPTCMVPLDSLLSVLSSLASEDQYKLCLDVLVVDYLPNRPRFEVVYHLYEPWKHARLRVKTRVAINQHVPSVTGIWQGANWPEREAFDLFGVVFDGHPELKRIYLPDDWDGHPLRKDYPMTGTRID